MNRIGRAVALAGALCSLVPGSSRGTGLLDVAPDAVPPFSTLDTLFPNWVMAPTTSLQLLECDDAICGTGCNITGLTIMNYGTATGVPGGDIKAMYWMLTCGSKTSSGILPMTFAGNWTVPIYGSLPAWTWGGNVGWGGNPCNNLGFACLCAPSLFLYTDIAACPTNGATVKLGPGFNDVKNPAWPGGMYDSCGYAAPWGVVTDTTLKTIRYVTKSADKDVIAPGDTVNYIIHYGRPGLAALTNVTVIDTMPGFTHLLPGGVPAADPGWNPDFGPPVRLRWTIPGPLAVAGGPTGSITFSLSVDWGNGEGFEPGSGDFGAPEGFRLANYAAADFPGTSCATKAVVTPATDTVVSRFRFWKVASNDVLFAPSPGQPPDEITYEIFLKNLSPNKTWWDVRVFDTVPVELDSWCIGCGFDDPCAGWTMTPGGCAAASPGRGVTGAQTLLTWRLDMPPGTTLTLRWRAQVKGTDTSGMTALNKVGVIAIGRTGIIEGTGSSGATKWFTHQAPIVLPTIYVSYLAMAAGENSYFVCCNDVLSPAFNTQTYFLTFFPLNQKTNFTLYEQNHTADAFALDGGLSPSISANAGGCLGGAGWIPGCGIERAPAWYLPPTYVACANGVPFHNLYKLVSNSPLIWELDSGDSHNGAEVSTWVGTTSLTYCGYSSYVYARTCLASTNRDGLYTINTSETTATTVHVFSWDAPSLSWIYETTAELDVDSQWFYFPRVQAAYRIISSDTKFVLFKALPFTGNPNTNAQCPNRENGFLSNQGTPATFYAFAENDSPQGGALIVTNLGAGTATYDIKKYFSANPSLPITSVKHQNSNLVGTSGYWLNRRLGDTAPAGYLTAGNPHVYQQGYDTGATDERSFYKIKLTSGGPIQVYSGYRLNDSFGGGSVFHSDNGTPAGTVYWYSLTELGGSGKICPSPYYGTMTVDVFMPKTGTAVQSVNNAGYSARYTTNGADEAISFMALSPPAAGIAYNWKMTATGGQIAVAQYQICSLHQKLFSAPFVAQGVHYMIIAPPVVYSGQSFWITLVVIQTAGGTAIDYCGTTSFTSTDPAAKVEGSTMDTYNYTWDSATGGGCPACTGTCDNGVHIFMNVTLNRLGTQTLVATDTVDGSIVGLTALQVVGADVKLTKVPRLSVQASGDTVQFRVCWSNYSSASAFTFVITDAIPNGTVFLPEAGTAAFDCGNTEGTVPRVAYSTTASPTPPAVFTEANPLPGTRWLRFTVPMAGVQTTGCVCYRVTVN